MSSTNAASNQPGRDEARAATDALNGRVAATSPELVSIEGLCTQRHARHVGTCPSCQRVQLGRWRSQLAQATRAESGR